MGPIEAYQQAAACMEAARREADAAREAAEARNPHFGCCGAQPLPETVAFWNACAVRDQARRNLPVDAMDSCDRPFMGETARHTTEHPPIPGPFWIAD